jgi:hypothetical protein
MKKNVIVFGLISGLLITGMMLYSANRIYSGEPFHGNEIVGYASMIIAFSLIFIGIRNFRDKYNGGVISFGKAFKIGFLITLVASTIYVGTWLVDYYAFKPGFVDKYITCMLDDAKANGASQAEIDKKASQMASFKEMYRNPVFVVLLTYMEVLPVGLVISLISAALLRKKSSNNS